MTTLAGGSRRIPVEDHGFDLGYRPASKADFAGPLAAILNGVSGHERRELPRLPTAWWGGMRCAGRRP